MRPQVAIATKQKTSVYSAVGLGIGIMAVVAVFVVIGATIFSSAPSLVATALDDTRTATLTWTAPGDDGNVGTAQEYDIRYSTRPITSSNYDAAVQVDYETSPKLAGSSESLVIHSLAPATTYYFVIKARDDNGNWSEISNVARHTTGCNPNWTCSGWSVCTNDTQSRKCVDQNVCGDTSTRPAVSRVCDDGVDDGVDDGTEVEPPVGGCVPDWTCSTWSSCVDGKNKRKCLDENQCGTISTRPAVVQTCQTNICLEDWTCSTWSTCTNERRTRECRDNNRCGTKAYKPVIEMGCRAVPPTPPQENLIITGTAPGGGPHVRVFRDNGDLRSQFFAYHPSFRGGVSVAAGDVDGDGRIEIVTGTGPNSAPHVRIFSLDGRLEGQFFAYPSFSRVGIDLAVADINGDGRDEIITAPLGNGGPHVRVFRKRGNSYRVVDEFFAYDTFFRGGVSIAAGDLNNDGQAEIVTIPHERGGPHVRVYKRQSGKYRLSSQFFAFPETFRIGLDVAIVNSDGPFEPRILVAAGPGGGPHLRIFSSGGKLRDQFFAADPNWRGGVAVASADIDQDGWDEIITGAYSNGAPGVFTFKYNFGTKEWERVSAFTAYHPLFQKGIRLYSPH